MLARDPLHLHAHARALQYWCDKWFGTRDLMWTFAEEGAAKHPKLAWLPLAAAFEASFAGAKDAWRLLPWLDGEGRDAPDTLNSRAYAALVELKRGPETVEQFRHLGRSASGPVWSYSEPRVPDLPEPGLPAREAAGTGPGRPVVSWPGSRV
ncbi:hypothetical protein G3I59_29710 [Amycolatopsis rubida]|uniref:DUF4034 domain-containing protein n=1 Tax=Amycolatopsis rubida TaxID=112413 RepID=A0ABX0BVJ9_9PSEU|nr:MULTISPECIES: hypothetical protein [Amycolatopsis]MYW94656.1 hypothetical protein [Amycolatopsis rubida]NEC59644.1 hypothetical protein [Amycolatopsis rubida]OAP27623.1 hypothetical protein A4R44_01228 [Amycolatopsis sp. M39]